MIAALIEAALRSLALAMMVWLSLAILRIKNPHQAKLVWTAVLLSALAMPALQRWGFAPTIPVLSVPLPTVALRGISWGAASGPVEFGLFLYLAITIVLLARLGVATVRLWRVAATAELLDAEWASGMNIRVTPRLSSPATFGSTILVPSSHEGWTQAKRTAILQHESAHVRSRDSYLQWIAAFHVCIFWFSPLSWWLRRRLAELAELASDDAVLAADIGNTDYAAVLLEMARARPANLIATGIAAGSIERRIDRILSGEPRPRSMSRLRCGLALLAVIPLVALAADVTPKWDSPRSDATLFGMDARFPHIISSPSLQDLMKWYPDEARVRGIDGLVQITVTLDEAGRATDTLVISETPSGMGFGAAASGLAHEFMYSNGTGHAASVTYRVKFELDRSGSQNTPTGSDIGG